LNNPVSEFNRTPDHFMNLLWKIKSPVYYFLRSIPGIAWILSHEKNNLAVLIADEDIPCQVLDIGTGAGSTLDIFPEPVQVIALDSSVDMLNRAASRCPGIIPVVGCAEALPFKRSSLQFISCIGVTEYLPDPEAVADQLNSVMMESGRLLTTLAPDSIFNRLRSMLGHRIYLNEGAFSEAFSRGFSIKSECRTWLQKQVLLRKR
jgi:SAM-dependent methyltransferase